MRRSHATWGREVVKMAQHVQNVFKFWNFMTRWLIWNSVWESPKPWLSWLTHQEAQPKRRPHEGNKFEDNAMIYENDMHNVLSGYNRLLYMTASIQYIQLRHALGDRGSSLNIIPLYVLKQSECLETESQSSPLRFPILKVTPLTLLTSSILT